MLLAAVLNRLLRQAPEARHELQALAGRQIALRLPLISACVVVTEDGWLGDSQAGPEATLTLPLAFFYTRLSDREAASRQVSIDGDAELARAFAAVLGRLQWDAAEELSQLVGDVAAQRLVWLAGKVAGVPGAVGARLLVALVEYLRDEAPLLASRQALAGYCNGVDEARDALARIEQRIVRLEQAGKEKH